MPAESRRLSPKADPTYEVAMSFSYLMNCVATLAIVGSANVPETATHDPR
jgi:hypothetical protein